MVYLTTAIDYANGKPHLGHAYEKVLTDVIARCNRMQGRPVYFLTGLDEHGQKVQQTAEKQGTSPQSLCDHVATDFIQLCKTLDISYEDYIRTTETRHKQVVQKILKNLFDQGLIYKDEYTGFYSTRAEQFLQEKDKINGKWSEEFGEVTEVTESNYFFKLSQYQDWLIDYIKSNPDFIFPQFRAKQVLEFLKDPINDLCISRPKERLSWGITLPFDENYVTYVWFDALINYISAVGYGTDTFDKHWPAAAHVIGKDILIPAHGIYWPIMLKAIGLELPKQLIVHGWWMFSGEKMSKSTGNIVNPLDVTNLYGVDAFRYFLIREMNVGQDSNFTLELFQSRYNDDLGNDLGNLVSRLLNMTNRYTDNKVPTISIMDEPEKELKTLWETTLKQFLELLPSYQFHTALDKLFTFIRGINRYAEMRSPWKLAKSDDPEDRKKVETALAIMAEGLRLGSALLIPVMPTIGNKIQTLLGLPRLTSWEGHLDWGHSLEGKPLGEKTILFPRVEIEQPATNNA